MNSRTRSWPGMPADVELPIKASAVDEYTSALIRGEREIPEVWLRARNLDAPPDPKAVAVLRSVDLLVRHRNALAGSPCKNDTSPSQIFPPAMDAPVMSPYSEPQESEPADALLNDKEWLAAHDLEPIGRLDVTGGGMGLIALAWHTGMKREVVLKVASKESDERRFLREIQVHAKLGGHINIAVTRTPLRYREASVLVVDYVPGLSLRRRVQLLGPMSWRESCDCIRQAAVGLSHAHRLGVTHRDVKSSNLVRSSRDGVVKVIDWGLALDRQAPDEFLTQSGAFLGTPQYCAPEQFLKVSEATPTSDLYGLGCVWYELLTGAPPFPGDRVELSRAHQHEPVPALPTGLGVPEAVERVLRRLLEKKPEDRLASAAEFIATLDRAVADKLIDRRLWLAAGAGGLVVAGLAYALRGRSPASSVPSSFLNLAATDLVIDLVDTSIYPKRSGKLGEKTFDARQGDQVTLRAELSRDAYCYLLSFRPDGLMDVWWPADEGERPTLTAAPCYPAGNSKLGINLDHGIGLQAFALVVSSGALPDFRTWRTAQGPLPWSAAIPADPGIVWSGDGGPIETCSSSDRERNRGAGAELRGALGAVVRLYEWLNSRPGVSVVCLKAFGVQPAQH